MSYSINVSFILSGVETPLDPIKYIIADAANPTTIEAGETVKLKFKADGIYFVMRNRKGASATGATLSWRCASPYTDAEITLTNAVSDVEIVITAVVKAAPQLVSKSFLYQMPIPVDTRLILSKREMLEVNEGFLPDIYFALCKDDGQFYLYNKTNESNEKTGKFNLITNIVEVNIKGLDGGEII